MIKVLIVVSGLVMFVPDAPPDLKGLTALLLDTRHRQAMTPHHITAHLPALRQQIDESYRGWSIITGEDERSANVSFSVPVREGSPINLDAKAHFPHLDELAAKPEVNVKIRPACLEGLETCRDQVATVVRFDGSWRARAIQRCDRRLNLPLGFGLSAKPFEETEAVQSEFRRIGIGIARPGEQRRLATALALEAEIKNINDLILLVNGSRQELQPTDKGVCKQWLGTEDACIVFEVESWEVPVRSNCDVLDRRDLPDECLLDRHFSLFYDLLTAPPNENQRWLPYVIAADDGLGLGCPARKDRGNRPAVRCPPTFCSQCK